MVLVSGERRSHSTSSIHNSTSELAPQFLQQSFRDLVIGVDVLHVVAILEVFNHPKQFLARFVVKFDLVLRLPDDLHFFRFAELIFERLGDGMYIFERAVKPVAFVIGFAFIGAGLNRGFQHRFGVGRLRLVLNLAHPVPKTGNRAGFAHIPARFRKDRANFTGGAGFGVALTPDDVLARIDVFDPAIPTTEGVRIGDPDTAVEAAYPDATVVREFLTDVYVVTGDHGTLQIEVARDTADLPGYWGTQVDRVVYLHATEITHPPFTVAASENIAGGCL